jgi:uncharacterized cysteine cluster protein YcgN (CxxCxxCC family)
MDVTMETETPFWEEKTLEEMSPEEWEAVCDVCGKCCLHKIEDENSGEVYFTNVVCRLLDLNTCRCTDYARRSEIVPECFPLTPDLVRNANWLPESCAYRRLVEGRGLAWWHPLVSGDLSTVRYVGASIFGKAVSEEDVDMADLEDMVVDWFD